MAADVQLSLLLLLGVGDFVDPCCSEVLLLGCSQVEWMSEHCTLHRTRQRVLVAAAAEGGVQLHGLNQGGRIRDLSQSQLASQKPATVNSPSMRLCHSPHCQHVHARALLCRHRPCLVQQSLQATHRGCRAAVYLLLDHQHQRRVERCLQYL